LMQENINLKEDNAQLISQTKALLSNTLDQRRMALEILLGYYIMRMNLLSTLKALGYKAFRFEKWLAITIIAGMSIIFLWANPEVLHMILTFFSSSTGAIIFFVAIIVVALILYKKGR